MEDSIFPSTSSEAVLEVKGEKSKSHGTIDLITHLHDNLRLGCVCDIKYKHNANNINPSTHTFGAILAEILKIFDDSGNLNNSDTLLVYMTFLRTIAKSSLNATCYEDSTENELYCKSLWEWQVLMKKLKFKLLQSIHTVWKNASRDITSHIRREAEVVFGYIFFIIPCPVEQIEDCHKTCQKIFQNFIQLSYSPELPIDHSFVLRLIHLLICEIEEPDSKRHKQLLKNQAKQCREAKVYIKVSTKYMLGILNPEDYQEY